MDVCLTVFGIVKQNCQANNKNCQANNIFCVCQANEQISELSSKSTRFCVLLDSFPELSSKLSSKPQNLSSKLSSKTLNCQAKNTKHKSCVFVDLPDSFC